VKNYTILTLAMLSCSTDQGTASPDGGSSPAAESDASAGPPATPPLPSTANDAGDAALPADGGASTLPGSAQASTGCGKAAPATGALTIDVAGTAREFIVALPKSYDANTPHKLVFAWHGLGGTAALVERSGFYGLQSQSADSTIFVAGQGLTTSNRVGTGPGWDNTNGRDVAFAKALYAQLRSTLCVDESRVFSVGMSYGGIMSNTLGCQMGDVLRAIAPMSGMGPGYGPLKPTCVGEVAVWMSHGNTDTTVPTAQGEASRDYWASANHCQATTKPIDPSPCVAYDGCDAGHPVTWCEFEGGHTIPAFASKAIWSFFSQF
jgi:polyhydroxybutyrate depolymerase